MTRFAEFNVKQAARIVVGTSISLLCLWLALRDVSWSAALASLQQAELGWILLALLSLAATNFLKAVRWRLLFHPKNSHLLATSLLSILLGGQAVTFAIPLRLGEVVRTYLVGARFQESKARTLTTIVVEKALDFAGLAVCLLLIVSAAAMRSSTPEVQTLAARLPVFVGISVGMFLFAVVALRFRHRFLQSVRGLATRVFGTRATRGLDVLESSLQGLDALRSPAVVLRLVVGTAVIWALAVATNCFALLALGLPADWFVSLTLLAVLQVGIAVPSSPGKVGVFQYLCQLTLGWFGVASANGFAFGILLYAIAPFVLMIVGGVALLRESWQLRRAIPAAVSFRDA